MRIRCLHCDAETTTDLSPELIRQLVDECGVCGELDGFGPVEQNDPEDADEERVVKLTLIDGGVSTEN